MDSSFQVNYEIRGSNRVANKLRAIAAFHPELTHPIIGKHTKSESARLRAKGYPPPRPRQKYVRTFTLKRSWQAQQMGPGAWRIINRAKQKGREYAVWVVKKRSPGMPGQAWMHFGRWWTGDDEVKRNMPKLTKLLTDELADKVNSIKGT